MVLTGVGGREIQYPIPWKGGVSVDAASIAHAPIAPRAPQHMQALAQANRVRLARAALKRSIARGEVSVASVVSDSPWQTESMTLSELLTSQRRWGRTRARKFLLSLALSENKRIGTLTPRQKSMLCHELEMKFSTEPSQPEAVLV